MTEAADLKERAERLLQSTRSILGETRSVAPGGSFERPPNLRLLPFEESSGERVEKAMAMGAGDVVAEDVQASNVLPSNDDVNTLFTMAGALFPPYDPEVLVSLYEHSNSLRQNVDAYATNIDAFGHTLQPVVDVKSEKAKEKIGDAIFLERLRDAEKLGTGAPQASYPTDQEIEARTTEIQQLARLEHAKLTNFFDFCSPEMPFTELRERTRVDLETTGNAYWEVLRDASGGIAQFHYVPGYSVRLSPIEHAVHDITVNQKVSAFTYERVPQKRRFRRFLQIVLDRVVFFKEFGDPRVISKRNGRVYANEDELLRDAQHDGPATELIHFKIHSPRSPYGVPRWIGVLLCVLGSRASEEVNFLYFDNKAVPPLAVLVSGGKLSKGATEKIQSYVTDNLKGKENFHKILILEAEPSTNKNANADNGRTRIAIEKLTDSQQKDGLFQEYDQNNIDKVGGAFRMPRLLRGDIRDFNRATAEAAISFAEMQVFQPEREKFDAIINRRIFSELAVRFWTFKSNSPVNRDPQDLTDIITKLATAGAVTPREVRELAADILNRELKDIPADWLDQPMVMTLAGIISGPDGAIDNSNQLGTPAPPGGNRPGVPATPKAAGDDMPSQEERDLTTVAGKVLALRAAMQKAAARDWARQDFRKAIAENADVVTVTLSDAQMRELVEPD